MITSTSNPQVREIMALCKKSRLRQEKQCFIAEGLRMVMETPKDRLLRLYMSESFKAHMGAGSSADIQELLAEAELVSDRVFTQMSDTKTPQGLLAVVRQEKRELQELIRHPGALLLCLEDIQDPGNLGTILRTAEGAGVTGIVMSRGTVDIYNPKVVRSTMGSMYRMPFVYAENFTEAVMQIRAAHIGVYAAYLQGSIPYDACDYTGKTAFLIGNEGNGLTEASAQLADQKIRIPMAGKVESLNAGVASAILMYEASRQRAHRG